MRTLIVIAALLTPVPAVAQSTCPTTASSNPRQFIPPAPSRAVLERGMFWYGSERLWTQLRDDGHWVGPYRPEDRPYRNKLPLFRSQFDWTKEPIAPVAIMAHRLDVSAPSITVALARGVFNDDTGSFMMTALDLPLGCWQIDAQYANEPPLTFVVAVP
jgi:hypothetical protein